MPVPSPAADRNLLFGLLALQKDLVNRGQLLDAMHTWMQERHASLAGVLCQQGLLGDEQRADLDRLVDDYVERHGPTPSSSLAALLEEPTIHVPGPHAEDAPAAPPVAPSRFRGPRYHRVRPHARGGLGEVYVALDSELQREVALKEIQEDHAGDLDNRARFLREAEITGKLEHPGVVPVYGLGTYPDGRPYYAMRFIRGEPMHEAIVRFHQADRPGRDPAERSLALRELLTRFVAVCNTVAYAHSRGVIHRDLKPANIMFGAYGETLVVDWGLARVLDQPDAEKKSDGAVRLTGCSSTVTALGYAVGTPAFMAPEQAAGEVDRVGTASDVFALGSTLYCLLTGEAPYGGTNALVLAGMAEVEPAGQRKRGVPAALEAVCAKAMAARPQRRYATARDLARDVERWLADEPVSVHREPWPERWRRWARRHRSLVSGAVVLLLAGVVGLGLGLWAVGREQARTAEALEQAQQNLERAEANLELAKKAVDECFNVAREDPLFQSPRMEKARKLLLEKTLPFYQQFQVQRPDDPALRREQANQLVRVAYIESVLGRPGRALEGSRQALQVLTRLAEDHPETARYQRDLARAHAGLGARLRVLGRRQEALREHRQALAIRTRLARSDSADDQNELARAHNLLGLLLAELGRRDEALAEHQRARDIATALVKTHPGVPAYRGELASTHNNRGALLYRLGRLDEALAEFRLARDLQALLAREQPWRHTHQADLASMTANLANVLSERGQHQEALEEYRLALAGWTKLVQTHPDVPAYRRILAGTHANRGRLLTGLGRVEEAVAEYRLGRNVLSELAKANPEVPAYRRMLAGTHNSLGVLLGGQGLANEALQEHQQALRLRRELARAYPDVPEHRDDLAGTHRNLGVLLRQQGLREEALKHHRQALDLWTKLAGAHLALPAYQLGLMQTNGNLGLVLRELGRHEEALEYYRRACHLGEKLAAAHPGVASYRRDLAGTYHNLANLLADLGRLNEALREHTQALGLRVKLAHAEPHVPLHEELVAQTCLERARLLARLNRFQDSRADLDEAIGRLDGLRHRNRKGQLSFALTTRAMVLTHLGQPGRAVADWDRALQLAPLAERARLRLRRAESLARAGDYRRAAAEADELGRREWEAGSLYDLACIQALNAARAAEDATRPLPERDRRAEEYARAALALLGRAAEGGHFRDPENVVRLDGKDLAGLWGRADFQRFRAGLKNGK